MPIPIRKVQEATAEMLAKQIVTRVADRSEIGLVGLMHVERVAREVLLDYLIGKPAREELDYSWIGSND